MRNGIYLKYLMTFPVGYAKETRDFIAESFYEGIKKSLPSSVINDKECMEQFKVELGISEPAAYAVTALEQSNLEPEESSTSAEAPRTLTSESAGEPRRKSTKKRRMTTYWNASGRTPM